MDIRTPPDGDTAALAHAIARGDSSAEAQLFQRFASRVRYLARRELRSPELAEDVCSETFLRVVTAIRAGRLQSPDALAGYVLQTTRHVIYETLRRAKHAGDPLDEEKAAALPAPEPETPDADVIAAVRETIAELSPRDRSFLRMCYVEDMDKADIARALAIDTERVRLIKSRALQRFKTAYLRRQARQGR